jgi:hypothetical protein
VPPALDPLDLAGLEKFELCRRHDVPFPHLPFPHLGIVLPRVFVQYDVSDFPFLGGLSCGGVNSP